jgi:hypothetical protein
MSSLRMGFDSMAAWDKTSVEFEDHIQGRYESKICLDELIAD